MGRGRKTTVRVGMAIFALAGCVLVVDEILEQRYLRALAVAALTIGLLVMGRAAFRSAD
ncbi:hypothetical protein [Streptomyces millisiae]|uniref:Uncharacterized protein n=1 Tax=Streptomyces millisiae TaxID=3075542 RepID=A0ABU2LRJ0_9ACTN|nr:hypothetical protein [Streptomyces sp. DSM 44918]MDT0320212.1 hypothetical protein [Streptomyces sp. DSM 44918]